MKYTGCAYYPEYWGYDRIDTDAVLMREAGMNVVRIGEFAWSFMEPQDGRFDFDWLRRAIEKLAHYEIQTILCTPTAAAPAWLVKAHPETLIVNKQGQRVYHGVRQHTCYVSPMFRNYAERVVEAMARAMSGLDSIVGWQIDNEIGCSMFGNCHCEACQERFREWLVEKYGTLEMLNRMWGTAFWSMVYTAWNEIYLGDNGLNLASSRVLDSYRFFSEMKTEYALRQADILRRHFPGTIITTNNIVGVDMYKVFGGLDRVGSDLYFAGPSMRGHRELISWMDFSRSVKPEIPYWLMETALGLSGFPPPVPHNRRFRPCFWSFIAHGAEAVLIFQWRCCLAGQEKYGNGILEHNGAARHLYKTVQQVFLESRALKERLTNLPMPINEVGIIRDFNAELTCAAGRLSDRIDPSSVAFGWYKALTDRQVSVDFLPPDRDWKNHRLIILPPSPHVPESLAEKIRSFVADGGVVVCVGSLGMMDDYSNFLSQSGPEHLNDVFGISLEGSLFLGVKNAQWGSAPDNVAASVKGTIGGQTVDGQMSSWIVDVELTGAKALLTFTEGTYTGQPAITMHRFGKGSAIYVAAAAINSELLEKLLVEALLLARVRPLVEAPAEVDVVRRGSIWFIINHADQAIEVRLNKAGQALLGHYAGGCACLEPYGVCIVDSKED